MTNSALQDWIDKHKEPMRKLIAELDLPEEMFDLAWDLWNLMRTRVSRTPNSLIVDCVYVMSHLIGQRRSIPSMKDAALIVLGRRTKPLAVEARGRYNERWTMTEWGKSAILSIVPDEKSYDDLIANHEAGL